MYIQDPSTAFVSSRRNDNVESGHAAKEQLAKSVKAHIQVIQHDTINASLKRSNLLRPMMAKLMVGRSPLKLSLDHSSISDIYSKAILCPFYSTICFPQDFRLAGTVLISHRDLDTALHPIPSHPLFRSRRSPDSCLQRTDIYQATYLMEHGYTRTIPRELWMVDEASILWSVLERELSIYQGRANPERALSMPHLFRESAQWRKCDDIQKNSFIPPCGTYLMHQWLIFQSMWVVDVSQNRSQSYYICYSSSSRYWCIGKWQMERELIAPSEGDNWVSSRLWK